MVTISNEEAAWKLLEKWVKDEKVEKVEFLDWPILKIRICGEDYNSSLNSSQMAALVELKQTIGRGYSAIAHGAYDARRLKDEESEQLEFTTNVKKGSSITETDLTPLVQALASVITSNPTASCVTGAVIGLALVARSVLLKHFDNKAKQIDANERTELVNLALNSREKAQYETFQKSIKKLEKTYPQIGKVIPDTARGFWKFASASANADVMTVAGIDLRQKDLEILSERRQKRPSDVTEIEQLFEVVGLKKLTNSYRIDLKAPNLIFSAVYRRPQMNDVRVRRLMKCMTDSIPILAKVEVKTVEKSQVSGRLIRFSPQEVEEIEE